ncbi:MAG: DUF3405 domain-containing protein [Chitinophagaceae bacterium]|jgi:hypothetical protein|nr:DUF3405 domain-containing protein [Chitinophagaceae bacterium]
MADGVNKQAFLILTKVLSKDIIGLYNKIKIATADLGDVYLLYHTNSTPVSYNDIKIETFTNDILHSLNYKPIRETLVPGSNHFPVLNFYLNHPGYTHYWCIEDDVAFNGNWKNFFTNISSGSDYDFITSHIRKHSALPGWHWWRTFNVPGEKYTREELYTSFNPIYRISNKALYYIDTCLKGGFSGHHEVLLPTLLIKEKFKIADFGTEDNFVTPVLSFCTLSTMRWKPVFLFPGNKKNKLYHPSKSTVTFMQILVYVKRTLFNQTAYHT